MRSAWRRYLLLRSVILTLVCLAIGLGVWHMRGLFGQLPASRSDAVVSLQAEAAADHEPRFSPQNRGRSKRSPKPLRRT